MNRAYSLFQTKSFDDERRIITGIATTPAPDRGGDIVEPKGAEFKLPIPFLWQHRSHEPIGSVTAASVSDDGIEITATVAKTDEPGTLKSRLDEAWQSLKMGLVAGLSIGFKPLEKTELEQAWQYRYLKWEWLELSAVTIPANAESSIQTIKSYDREVLAALGQGAPVVRLDNSLIRRVSRKKNVVYLD